MLVSKAKFDLFQNNCFVYRYPRIGQSVNSIQESPPSSLNSRLDFPSNLVFFRVKGSRRVGRLFCTYKFPKPNITDVVDGLPAAPKEYVVFGKLFNSNRLVVRSVLVGRLGIVGVQKRLFDLFHNRFPVYRQPHSVRALYPFHKTTPPRIEMSPCTKPSACMFLRKRMRHSASLTVEQ